MYWSETCRLSRPAVRPSLYTLHLLARVRPGRTLDLQLYVPWSPFTDYAKPQVAATWLRGARLIMLSPWTSQVCCTTRVYTGTGVFQQDRFDCHMANHCSVEKFCTADGFTKKPRHEQWSRYFSNVLRNPNTSVQIDFVQHNPKCLQIIHLSGSFCNVSVWPRSV